MADTSGPGRYSGKRPPRLSSPKGVEARHAARIKGWEERQSARGIHAPGVEATEMHKPGSRNPRKVGR